MDRSTREGWHDFFIWMLYADALSMISDLRLEVDDAVRDKTHPLISPLAGLWDALRTRYQNDFWSFEDDIFLTDKR